MAEDLNRVTLVGRLTRDIESKYTKSGTPVGRISLASNYRTKSGDEWTEEVSYFDCELWGRRVESIGQYLTIGTKIWVDGELRQDRWLDADGNRREKVKVRVSNIGLLGSSNGGGSKGGGSQSSMPDDFDDDIPF